MAVDFIDSVDCFGGGNLSAAIKFLFSVDLPEHVTWLSLVFWERKRVQSGGQLRNFSPIFDDRRKGNV
jgi:hypothetical protein